MNLKVALFDISPYLEKKLISLNMLMMMIIPIIWLRKNHWWTNSFLFQRIKEI